MSSDILRLLFSLGDQHFSSKPEHFDSGGVIPPIHQNTTNAGLDCSLMADAGTSVSSLDSGRGLGLTIPFDSSMFCSAADVASNDTTFSASPPPTYVNSSSIPSDWKMFDSPDFLSECWFYCLIRDSETPCCFSPRLSVADGCGAFFGVTVSRRLDVFYGERRRYLTFSTHGESHVISSE